MPDGLLVGYATQRHALLVAPVSRFALVTQTECPIIII